MNPDICIWWILSVQDIRNPMISSDLNRFLKIFDVTFIFWFPYLTTADFFHISTALYHFEPNPTVVIAITFSSPNTMFSVLSKSSICHIFYLNHDYEWAIIGAMSALWLSDHVLRRSACRICTTAFTLYQILWHSLMKLNSFNQRYLDEVIGVICCEYMRRDMVVHGAVKIHISAGIIRMW